MVHCKKNKCNFTSKLVADIGVTFQLLSSYVLFEFIHSKNDYYNNREIFLKFVAGALLAELPSFSESTYTYFTVYVNFVLRHWYKFTKTKQFTQWFSDSVTLPFMYYFKSSSICMPNFALYSQRISPLLFRIYECAYNSKIRITQKLAWDKTFLELYLRKTRRESIIKYTIRNKTQQQQQQQ